MILIRSLRTKPVCKLLATFLPQKWKRQESRGNTLNSCPETAASGVDHFSPQSWEFCICPMLGIMKTGCALMKTLAMFVNEDGGFAA